MQNEKRMFRLLHTNDMHGTLTPEIQAKLSELRKRTDLYFDSGDSIKTGNLGVPTQPDPVWLQFQQLQLTASVLGNRETHPIKAAMDMKTKGASHPILIANIQGANHPPSTTLEINGCRIGLLGVMVPMATEKMKTAFAWAYRWSNPIPAAIEQAKELRAKVDVVIALTHIGYQQDVKLAESTGDIDIILGGHSHTVLTHPEKVNQTYICQGGSHNRYAGVYEWNNGKLTGELKELKSLNP